jgi:hypothetical protein
MVRDCSQREKERRPLDLAAVQANAGALKLFSRRIISEEICSHSV